MATTQSPPFGDLLRHYRRNACLTQEELAEQAGVSARVISDLERGLKHRPRKDTIQLLSTALQLQPEERAGFESAARRLGQESAEISPPAQVQLPIGNYLGALPHGPLVAREEELARLQFALDTVEAGAGQLVLLAGESGIGKTRLAQEVSLRARSRRFVVAVGSCYGHSQASPLYPFVEALPQAYESAPPAFRSEVPDRWPVLKSLLPVQPGVPTNALPTSLEQQGLTQAVTGFLAALSSTRPVALLVDDLQWADQPTLVLLQRLAHRTRAHRVLILGTYRDTELDKDHPVRQAVHDLTREHLLERITLGRLTVEGTAAMVASVVGETGGVSEFAEFVHRRTKGNPSYIDTMLRALGGHYRLVREIGAGGMGRVFEAVETRTGERVAAKIMFSRSDADLHALRRFEQEGAVLATLEHEHIVKVKGTFIDEHASCIIMELLEGESLGRLMRTENMSLARTKCLSVQVASALAYAHGRHIVHRDIKPDNVMVVGRDHVKVTDFGIARMLRPAVTLASMTSTGLTLGTPLYMAPEQIEGRRVDGRTDLYSLGAMLYHLVTGRPVFEGDDPLTIAFRHVHEAPEPPRSMNGRLPVDWEAVILKALAKDPAERFQTAAAMEAAITALPVDEHSADALPVHASSEPAALLAKEARPERSATLSAGELVSRAVTRLRAPGSLTLAAATTGVVALILGVLLVLHLLPSSSRHAGSVRLALRRPVAIFGGSAPRPADRLQSPSSLAVDPSGNLYVADVGHSRIQRLSPHGRIVTEWGTEGTDPGQFENPIGIALDGHGNVYVADNGSDRVDKFSSAGKLLAAHGPIYSQNPPPARALQTYTYAFSLPTGIGVDGHGHVLVPDAADQCLDVFSSSLELQGCWGGNGPNGWAGPGGVAVDTSDDAYVVDSGNDRIVKLSPPPAFRILHTWGTSGAGLGQLVSPVGVAVGRQGNIFVVDSYTCRVLELSPTGTLLAVWGKPGTNPGEFRNPQGIAVDSRGNVYVADSGNNRVQEFAAG
jgi:serine/threonine-protein kinase